MYVTLVLRVDLSSLKRKNCLEIRKSQDLAKDFGATASKAEKKICKTKNCKLYIRNITKLLYLKCKLKERKKKKKDEKKTSGEEKVMSGTELETSDTPGQRFTTRPSGTHRYYR